MDSVGLIGELFEPLQLEYPGVVVTRMESRVGGWEIVKIPDEGDESGQGIDRKTRGRLALAHVAAHNKQQSRCQAPLLHFADLLLRNACTFVITQSISVRLFSQQGLRNGYRRILCREIRMVSPVAGSIQAKSDPGATPDCDSGVSG